MVILSPTINKSTDHLAGFWVKNRFFLFCTLFPVLNGSDLNRTFKGTDSGTIIHSHWWRYTAPSETALWGRLKEAWRPICPSNQHLTRRSRESALPKDRRKDWDGVGFKPTTLQFFGDSTLPPELQSPNNCLH